MFMFIIKLTRESISSSVILAFFQTERSTGRSRARRHRRNVILYMFLVYFLDHSIGLDLYFEFSMDIFNMTVRSSVHDLNTPQKDKRCSLLLLKMIP